MIKIENLDCMYKTSNNQMVQALKGINLTINPGEFVAIIGANGSGKSTLAKHMNGIMLPKEGDVFVFGKNTKEEQNNLFIKKSVGMVFQNPDNQFVTSVVEEDIAFALENLEIPFDEMHERVRMALECVGMYEYKDASIESLSGGQKQKIAIAGAIVMQPKFLVFDEPTSMLDPQSREEICSLLKRLNETMNIGIIFITQFMEEVALAKRVIVMNDGKIVKDISPGCLFEDIDFLESMKLKAPQITYFCLELNKLGENINPGILDLKECADELAAALKGNKL
ncbi:MAG: energy-coupling factor transporter ATPase [Oscillospiraceae bacterium]|nr:energy-coupling factor transporter ATPase [Oscillospiraceae bacterium]